MKKITILSILAAIEGRRLNEGLPGTRNHQHRLMMGMVQIVKNSETGSYGRQRG